MSLLDRVMHIEQPTMPNHAFVGAMNEWALGGMTRAEVLAVAKFNIQASEEAELDWLKARYNDAETNGKAEQFALVFTHVVSLVENGCFYTTKAEVQARLVTASGP